MLFGGDGLQKGFRFGSTIFISFPIKCLVDQAILIGVFRGFTRGISKFVSVCTLTIRCNSQCAFEQRSVKGIR